MGGGVPLSRGSLDARLINEALARGPKKDQQLR